MLNAENCFRTSPDNNTFCKRQFLLDVNIFFGVYTFIRPPPNPTPSKMLMLTNALALYRGKYLSLSSLSHYCLLESTFGVIRKYYSRTIQTSSLAPLFKNLVPANSFDLRAISVTYIGRPKTQISVSHVKGIKCFSTLLYYTIGYIS